MDVDKHHHGHRRSRPHTPLFETSDLARQFGFDITISDGGLVASAVSQRRYQIECQKIYNEFLLNMGEYLSEEQRVRQDLHKLLEQRRGTAAVQEALKEGSGEDDGQDEAAHNASQSLRNQHAATQMGRIVAESLSSRHAATLGASHGSRGGQQSLNASQNTRSASSLGASQNGRGGGQQSLNASQNSRSGQQSLNASQNARTGTSSLGASHGSRGATSHHASSGYAHVTRGTVSAGVGRRAPEPAPADQMRPQTVMGVAEPTETRMLKSRKSVANFAKTWISKVAGRRAGSAGSEQEMREPIHGVQESNGGMLASRKIRVPNTAAFNRLSGAQLPLSLANKSGQFVMKAVSNSSSAAIIALDRERDRDDMDRQSYDVREKVAIVRQKTTFKSPTLSSDLKRNNLVAIQKSLMGMPTKRITVTDVMKEAADRRSRLFKVQVSKNEHEAFSSSLFRGGRMEDKKISHVQESHQGADPEDGLHRPIINVHVSMRGPGAAPGKPGGQGVTEGAQGGGLLALRKAKSAADAKRQYPTSPRQGNEGASRMTPSSKTARFSPSASAVPTVHHSENHHAQHRGHHSGDSRMRLPGAVVGTSMPPPSHDLSRTPRIHSQRDTVAVVKRWKQADREREEKLNRWRQRMSFAAIKKSSLARVLVN